VLFNERTSQLTPKTQRHKGKPSAGHPQNGFALWLRASVVYFKNPTKLFSPPNSPRAPRTPKMLMAKT